MKKEKETEIKIKCIELVDMLTAAPCIVDENLTRELIRVEQTIQEFFDKRLSGIKQTIYESLIEDHNLNKEFIEQTFGI